MKDSIKTIIWDLDNTLYKFSEFSVWEWHKGVSRFMQSKGIDMSLEEAMELAHKGWTDHRNSNYYFTEKYDIDARDAHLGMFQYLDAGIITPCEHTPALMKFMNEHKHIILTFATKDWANRILDRTGLSEFFHPDYIFGAEDYDFEDKAHSARGILMALDKIGGNADEVLFVEDTLPNLKPAKEEAGVYTAYLHHNRPINDNDMGYVDMCVQDTPELLRWFKEPPAK